MSQAFTAPCPVNACDPASPRIGQVWAGPLLCRPMWSVLMIYSLLVGTLSVNGREQGRRSSSTTPRYVRVVPWPYSSASSSAGFSTQSATNR